MRYVTTAVSVAIVAGIILAAAYVYVEGDDGRQVREEAYEAYDIAGYFDYLEEHGIHTWNPGRLWPGSIDPPRDFAENSVFTSTLLTVSNSY
jgi:hypothetical protein